MEAYEKNLISEETAMLSCTKRGVVSRGIDNVKKQRGEATDDVGNLRMKMADELKKKGGTPSVPVGLKLK